MAVVKRHQHVRKTEARRAEGIVEDEIQTFAVWLGSLEILPIIAALREHGEEIVAGLLEENAGRWESLSERDLARVEALARAVANRLLHEPTLRVKQAGAGEPPRAHAGAARAVRARGALATSPTPSRGAGRGPRAAPRA